MCVIFTHYVDHSRTYYEERYKMINGNGEITGKGGGSAGKRGVKKPPIG